METTAQTRDRAVDATIGEEYNDENTQRVFEDCAVEDRVSSPLTEKKIRRLGDARRDLNKKAAIET